MIFQTSTSAKVVIFQNLHSSGFEGLFDVATTTRVEILAPLKTSLNFEFLVYNSSKVAGFV